MSDKTEECPSCGLDADRDAEQCPYCGYEFPRQRSSLKIVAWLLALLLAWPVIQLLITLF